MRIAALALIFIAACGDDTPPPPPPSTGGGAPGAPAAAAAATGPKLQPRAHVEERVACAVPDKPTGPVCKPETPTCEAGTYCLPQLDNSFHCEACPERDSIRHEFKDRDFVNDGTADHERDPFQSFVIQQGIGKPTEKTVEPGPCTRPDQFVAPNYSYQELKLVGIVQQGTQRKVLMMAGQKGAIIKRGDCVGKEKALVKDIGTGYVTFLINPEASDNGPKRPSEEHSVQLYPNGPETQVDEQPGFVPGAPTGPTIAPPAGTPTVAPPPAQPAAAQPRTIVVPPPPQQPQRTQVQPPPQAPTTLSP